MPTLGDGHRRLTRLALWQRPQPAPAERARPARPEPAVDTALRVEEVPARRHHAHQLVAQDIEFIFIEPAVQFDLELRIYLDHVI